MKTKKTKIKDLLIVMPDMFRDARGQFVEMYSRKRFLELGIALRFVEDNVSVSRKNVLRGIHGDFVTWKLITCLYGEVFFVAVDFRKSSATYGKWLSFNLSAQEKLQVLIPPGCGNGHYVLSKEAVFRYKRSTYFKPGRQFTYKWDDPRFKIPWPVKKPILSQRDIVGCYVD